MKQSLRYDQVSCRLRVDGVPDLSAGQSSDAIGILTGWSLEWLGRPPLEGRRDHLLAVMQVVLPYARHLISGVARPFGQADDPAVIGPDPEGGHLLRLRSSNSGTPPLDVRLDDAELADLVRVLDELRLDPRLQIDLPVPPSRPLRARELMERVPLPRLLAAPLGGAVALALTAAAVVLLPPPPAPRPEAAGTASGAPRTGTGGGAATPPGSAPPSGLSGTPATSAPAGRP